MTPKETQRKERHAYPVNDACFELGIKRSLLYALAKRGELKLIKIAGRTVVPDSEIKRLTRADQTKNAALRCCNADGGADER